MQSILKLKKNVKLEIQLEFCVKQTEKEIDGEPRKEALINAVHDAHRARRHHETRFFKYSTYLMSNCQKLSPKSGQNVISNLLHNQICFLCWQKSQSGSCFEHQRCLVPLSLWNDLLGLVQKLFD